MRNSLEAMRLWAAIVLVLAVACATAGKAGPTESPPVKGKARANGLSGAESDATNAPPANASADVTPAARTVDTELNGAPEPSTRAVMPDVDYWATPQPVVDKMLELAQIKASDVVYDLGCGDARSLITAAERYGAKCVGFDIDPQLVSEARENARRHGVEKLVTIEQANIFTLDLSPASVIFLYLTPRFNLRLVPQLVKLRPGSRIVAHEFEIPGAKPTRIVHVMAERDGPPDLKEPKSMVSHKIYFWKIPWQKQWTDWKP